jgi:formylmethanofuran dehydrogenase subunit E
MSMGVSEKVAYLKGLMEGIKLDEGSDNAKLFKAIVSVLDEIALEIEDLTDEVSELGDGLDVLSEDLEDIEDLVYDEDDEEDDDEPVYATTCPECEEEIFFDEDYLEDGVIVCPNCGAKLEFDAADLEDSGDEE